MKFLKFLLFEHELRRNEDKREEKRGNCIYRFVTNVSKYFPLN